MAARMAMMTMTMRSSTMVKAEEIEEAWGRGLLTFLVICAIEGSLLYFIVLDSCSYPFIVIILLCFLSLSTDSVA